MEDGTSTVIGLVCALLRILEAPGDRSESSYITRYDCYTAGRSRAAFKMDAKRLSIEKKHVV